MEIYSNLKQGNREFHTGEKNPVKRIKKKKNQNEMNSTEQIEYTWNGIA